MDLSSLTKTTEKTKKRLGRGHGSGRGKTAGRGTKGQNARGRVPLGFEGGQQSIIRRLPLLRGKDRNRSYSHKFYPVNVKFLNLLPADTVVDAEILIKHHILSANARGMKVKILGDGDLKVALIVKLPCSKGALAKIEKAGGKQGSFDSSRRTDSG
ncbi:MAG: 50S ribosomal protein L15 [Candidatus Gottesmanbacteria bacterium GW2011_GWA2_41_12]|nr:MAG: 50S ribosomal protein L15 [Candidatus Gottesmanbacteria bacterium GW2011_GWA2_41_12]